MYRNDKIKFIRFEAPSISGQAIGMLVPIRQCEYFLRKGFPFASLALMQTAYTIVFRAFAGTGFRNIPNFVDMDSYKILPWKELTPTASLFMFKHRNMILFIQQIHELFVLNTVKY